MQSPEPIVLDPVKLGLGDRLQLGGGGTAHLLEESHQVPLPMAAEGVPHTLHCQLLQQPPHYSYRIRNNNAKPRVQPFNVGYVLGRAAEVDEDGKARVSAAGLHNILLQIQHYIVCLSNCNTRRYATVCLQCCCILVAGVWEPGTLRSEGGVPAGGIFSLSSSLPSSPACTQPNKKLINTMTACVTQEHNVLS